MTPYFLEAQEGLLTPSFFLTLLTPGVFPEHIPVGSHFPRGEPLISRVLEAESHCSFPIAPSLQGSCWQGDALHTSPSLARARGREEPVLAQTRPLCSVAASAACLPPPHPTPSLLLLSSFSLCVDACKPTGKFIFNILFMWLNICVTCAALLCAWLCSQDVWSGTRVSEHDAWSVLPASFFHV